MARIRWPASGACAAAAAVCPSTPTLQPPATEHARARRRNHILAPSLASRGSAAPMVFPSPKDDPNLQSKPFFHKDHTET